MRRGSIITSVLALAGIGFAVMQMFRRGSKPTGWRMIAQRFNQMMSRMTTGSNRMLGMVRSRVRM